MGLFDFKNYKERRAAMPVSIDTSHPWALGTQLGAWRSVAPASNDGTANLARFVPLVLPSSLIVNRMFTYNGAVVAGNVDVGLYDALGARLVSSGSVAQAGINQLQHYELTPTLLRAGLYYMAVVFSSGSATIFTWTLSTPVGWTIGHFGMETAFPLPSTAVLANKTGRIPVIGLSAHATL